MKNPTKNNEQIYKKYHNKLNHLLIRIAKRMVIVENLVKLKMISNLLGILSISYLINKNQKASYQGRS